MLVQLQPSVIGWISRTRNSQPPKNPNGWILNNGSFQKDIYIYIVSPLPMLHLFLQLQATSPGPHPIHTGRTLFLPGKTNKLKMMCLYQKASIHLFQNFIFRWKRTSFFPRSFSIGIIPQHRLRRPTKKTKIGLGGYFEARHHGFNFINLRKTIQHGPLSSKSVGMRMAWGLMVRSWFLQKKDGGKGKEHVKQTNESNKSET